MNVNEMSEIGECMSPSKLNVNEMSEIGKCMSRFTSHMYMYGVCE